MKAGAFFGELKRRNVVRAAAFYAAAVWALAQGIAQLTPVVNAPEWIDRWFLVAAVIGFPFWIAFAWFYEITPSGLKRESEIAPSDSIAHSTGRKLDLWIIGILAVAVVLLVTNQFVLRRDATSTADAANAKALAATLAKVPQKSVAVLPFANESGDPKQQYFSDGLSEELISDLTQVNGLKVIGKYSSFKFRDSKDSPAQIGAALGVAHLIQGAVRQQGDRIRVTVGMIRAADGTSVWSHSYDQPLKDVFSIQTQIGEAVAAALKIKLLGQPLGVNDKPPSGNVEAYKLMLQGRALARHNTGAGYRQGIALLKQALQLDTNYAYAWGALSNVWLNLGQDLTGDARQQAYAQALIAAEKQQMLAPGAAATHMSRGYLLQVVDKDPARALAEYRRAFALAPNDGTVMMFLAIGLSVVGQLQPAAEMYRKAIATDPLRTNFYANLAYVLLSQGQLDAAEQVTRKALALQPNYPGLYLVLATIDMARGHLDAAEQATRKEMAVMQPDFPGLYSALAQIDLLRGDAASALRNANRETDPDSKAWALAAVAQIAPDRKKADAALQDYLTQYGKDQPYAVAQLYALRKQPGVMFEWLERARRQHDPALIASLLSDPFVLAYQHDPRFAALCKEAGLPLPGQPLPAAAGSTSATPPATNDVPATTP